MRQAYGAVKLEITLETINWGNKEIMLLSSGLQITCVLFRHVYIYISFFLL